jgi:hypothetical protein
LPIHSGSEPENALSLRSSAAHEQSAQRAHTPEQPAVSATLEAYG